MNGRTDQSLHSVLDALQAQRRYVFSRDDVAALTGRDASSVALTRALDRAREAGRISGMGRYPMRVIVPPEHRHYGAPPVEWWVDDVMSKLDPNYYVALMSAARHWGSAHYALQATQLMVAKPMRDIVVGKRRLTFFSKARLASTPVVIVQDGVAPWRISTREATAIDILHNSSKVGGLEAAARVVHDLQVEMEPAALREALDALGQRASAQRLGFLLERLGAPSRLASAVEKWLTAQVVQASRSTQAQLLDRAGERADLVDQRWKVRFDEEQARMLEELT